MLSKKSLETRINSGEILRKSRNIPLDMSSINLSGSSCDLTVGRIFQPENAKTILNQFQVFHNYKIDDVALEKHRIKPGEMALIEVKEYFAMPRDMGGILFPPNKLAKEGLLMTNPGHVDPGYRGLVTVCLVNMGRQEVHIAVDQVITTLLLVGVDEPTDGYAGSEGKGVHKTQLQSLDVDFAGLKSRLPGLITEYISHRVGAALALVGLVFASYALILPELGQYRIESKKEEEIAQELIEPLREAMITDYSKASENIQAQLDSLKKVLLKVCENSKTTECKELSNP
nr:hypothetical protein [Neiella litorisoli]